ncbi:hypothetical protein H3146_05785 [Streptomyces sp. OF3]|uniref:Helix-turn-helix domain-containing protein n=1 Tax=Streptomyces alkaliterrae TaxID=2213162 RepID=A0A7W3WID9_9ACTN|nr:hypothetical protein [Streptomyces alkaliterrae]MBB1252877.1 hypothetical protein [Streptomyces alkaliterrae]
MPKRPAPPEGYIYIDDVETETGTILGIASRLGIAPSTYRKWRMAGIGPRTFRNGKRVLASVDAVDEYLAEQARAAGASHDSRPAEPRIAA